MHSLRVQSTRILLGSLFTICDFNWKLGSSVCERLCTCQCLSCVSECVFVCEPTSAQRRMHTKRTQSLHSSDSAKGLTFHQPTCNMNETCSDAYTHSACNILSWVTGRFIVVVVVAVVVAAALVAQNFETSPTQTNTQHRQTLCLCSLFM